MRNMWLFENRKKFMLQNLAYYLTARAYKSPSEIVTVSAKIVEQTVPYLYGIDDKLGVECKVAEDKSGNFVVDPKSIKLVKRKQKVA